MDRARFPIVSRFVMVTLSMLTLFADGASATSVPFLTGADTTFASNGAFTLGYQIIVGSQPIQLNALGLWDEGADGLSASHAVGIWNLSGSSLLASVTVPPGAGTSLVDGYRFVNLGSPINLAANMTYVLGTAYNTNDLARDITGVNFASRNSFASPGVSLGKGEFEFGSSLTFPSGDVSTIYTGPNGLFSVPEPSAALLALLACALSLAFRRKMRAT